MSQINSEQIKKHVEEKFDQWLDNSDPNNLGIVQWANELLPEYTPNSTPDLHRELFLYALALYDDGLVNKYERLFELISYRGSAKSTAANTILAAYIGANNGKRMKILVNFKTKLIDGKLIVTGGKTKEITIRENFIVIASETGSMAESFTQRIRDEFTTNKNIKYYYKLQIKDAMEDITGQWTRSAFKLNRVYYLGVGVRQQIRGRIKGASRPTLLIADDLYSENNTITPESRSKVEDWWNKAAFNTVDDLVGKVVLLGTIIHDDTVLVKLEKNSLWKTIKRSVMPIGLFHEFMEKTMYVDEDKSLCELEYDDIEEDWERRKKQKKLFAKIEKEKNWQLAWADRANLYFLALKYKEAVLNRSTSSFYQEYFHITRSPSDKRITRDMFTNVKVEGHKFEHSYNWIKLEGEEKWIICNIEFGIDQASGFSKDFASIVVVAVLPDNRRVIILIASGKWSSRDKTDQSLRGDLRHNKVITDTTQIIKKGTFDEAVRLAIKYHPSRIKMGFAGQEKRDVYDLRQLFIDNNIYDTQVIGRPQTSQQGKKEDRILTGIGNYYYTLMVYHNGNLINLEYQLEYLGKADNDDEADALECAFYQIMQPPSLDIDTFEEVAESLFEHRNQDSSWDWRIN